MPSEQFPVTPFHPQNKKSIRQADNGFTIVLYLYYGNWFTGWPTPDSMPRPERFPIIHTYYSKNEKVKPTRGNWGL